MSRTAANCEEGLRESLGDPQEAAAYLNAALEDGSQDVFLLALRDVAQIRGMSEATRRGRLSRGRE